LNRQSPNMNNELLPSLTLREMTETEIRLTRRIEELQTRLAEAEETLSAIRNGEVDAIVVSGRVGEKIFSLASAETPYRLLIENMEEGTVTLTKKGIILYCNAQFISMTGLPEGKITGTPIFSFIDRADQIKFRAFLKRGRSIKEAGEFRMTSPSNEEEIFRFTVNALPAEMNGDLFLLVSNITALRKYEHFLEVERKKLRDILNIIPAYLILVSPADFSILFANDYFRKIYGDPGSRKCYDLIFGNTEPCDRCRHSKHDSSKRPFQGELVDASSRIYQVTSFPFSSDTEESVILEMGVDVTDKRYIEHVILAKSFETEEREKKRIAGDLHDDLGQALSLVKLYLGILNGREQNEMLITCDELLTDVLEKLRTISYTMSPALVEKYGLETALLSFIPKIEQTNKLRFNYSSNLGMARFEPKVELHLYRIISELVNNTLRHSGATKIFLDLKLNDSDIHLLYSDNGKGYSAENEFTRHSGIGLQNIRNRVEILHGNIRFARKSGRTIVEIGLKISSLDKKGESLT
jgi:PAS domain S-box-containing protein